MNYIAYYPCDLVNGEGVRATLFVSGCNHACKGCHNKASWRIDKGEAVTDDFIEQMIIDLKDRDGLSISGGDPLHPFNIDDVYALCQKVKAAYPEKTIWLWTGYLLEEFINHPILQVLDVIIDGKFEQNNPTEKSFRGSHNQRLFVIENGIAHLSN